MSETIYKNLKPVTRNETYWAAMADDTITPPEPQTTEECILAAMSGNYPADKIKPQTREQGLMKQAAVKMGTLVEQNVEWADGMTSIPYAALSSCKLFKKITIPEGVTEIVTSAFNNNTNLEEVNFPSTLKTIWASAFGECAKLTKIVLSAIFNVFAASLFKSDAVQGIHTKPFHK